MQALADNYDKAVVEVCLSTGLLPSVMFTFMVA